MRSTNLCRRVAVLRQRRAVKHEFVDRDVEATMRTMVEEPSKMAGGYDGIADCAHGGRNQVVDELLLRFAYNVPLCYRGVSRQTNQSSSLLSS